MVVREAGAGDLETVVAMRLAFVAEHRGVELDEGFAAATAEWVAAARGEGRLCSWLAEDDAGGCVGVVSLLLTELPPRPGDDRRHDGYVLNMYVSPPQRRTGLGRRLLDACLTGAAARGVRTVSLRATDAGRPLYERAGFRPEAAWLSRPASGGGG
jgi:GNAT superfamily N-acetyltransferase